MQRFGRPFHVDAVGIFSLEPELRQHPLDIQPHRHFRVPRAIVGAAEIEIGDRVAQRLVPPSEQREHDRRRQKPQPGGDADERERHIEFGLVRPPLDEREIVHDKERALAIFRGERKESDRDSRLLFARDSERVDFRQRRLWAMDGARHILGRVKHAPLGTAEAQRLEPLVFHELFEEWLQIAWGLRHETFRDTLVDGSEHQASAQFDVALRPFVDNDRRHLGHRGDQHCDRRQPEKGVTDRGNPQPRRCAGSQIRPPTSGSASEPPQGAADHRGSTQPGASRFAACIGSAIEPARRFNCGRRLPTAVQRPRRRTGKAPAAIKQASAFCSTQGSRRQPAVFMVPNRTRMAGLSRKRDPRAAEKADCRPNAPRRHADTARLYGAPLGLTPGDPVIAGGGNQPVLDILTFPLP